MGDTCMLARQKGKGSSGKHRVRACTKFGRHFGVRYPIQWLALFGRQGVSSAIEYDDVFREHCPSSFSHTAVIHALLADTVTINHV